MKNTLWYNKQADSWMDGLPIGNGRIAAMVWGTAGIDRLSLNHEWLWRGLHRQRDNTPVAEHLDEVRKFIKEGDYFRATNLANTYFGGLGGLTKMKRRVDSYQPAGDLFFELDNVKSFLRRQLDINEAVVEVDREITNNEITNREISNNETKIKSTFISHPQHNLVIGNWKAQNGKFSGKLYFLRVKDDYAVEKYEVFDDKIRYNCSFKGGISFVVEVNFKTDGELIKNEISSGLQNGITVKNASELMIYVNIATSESGMEEEFKKYPIPKADWDQLLRSHKEAFSSLLGRLKLNIDLPENNNPTDMRIAALKSGAEDPALLLLYFNYGRYLLAASSICGELPANLQGKWNDNINPPWECDYHFDINIQMNYWMTEAANMHECAEALIKYIERMIPHGRKAAKDLYGCRGVYLPLTCDAWAKVTPEACGWGVWIGAAPWIAQHFWWHYIYSGDIQFLKERAYPFFKDIALFYEDYLVEDDNGILQIMPSQSPENRFEGTGFWPVSIGKSSAMDVQLAYDALDYAIKSANILGVDKKESDNWGKMKSKLPSFGIGNDGRLLEWDIERVEVEPGHRHLSHLYGLHPSDLFNPVERPQQFEAAVKSLNGRLSQGGGHTGWSRAWVSCFCARIGNANGLWEHLQALIKDFATESLLDLHPPQIFQIDGNLGAVAAVLEGLVQSWGGKTHILRALPKEWANGNLSGIVTPGGHILNFEWKNGKLISLEIILGYAEEIMLEYDGKDLNVKGKKGEKYMLSEGIFL